MGMNNGERSKFCVDESAGAIFDGGVGMKTATPAISGSLLQQKLM